jgi:hypothetical protein
MAYVRAMGHERLPSSDRLVLKVVNGGGPRALDGRPQGKGGHAQGPDPTVDNKNGGDFMAEEMVKYKKCAICKNEIEASDENFSKNKALADGLDKACRKCKSAEAKAYRARKNMEAVVLKARATNEGLRPYPEKGFKKKDQGAPVAANLVDISPIIEKAVFHAGELKKISNFLEVLRATTGAKVEKVKLDLGVWG